MDDDLDSPLDANLPVRLDVWELDESERWSVLLDPMCKVEPLIRTQAMSWKVSSNPPSVALEMVLVLGPSGDEQDTSKVMSVSGSVVAVVPSTVYELSGER